MGTAYSDVRSQEWKTCGAGVEDLNLHPPDSFIAEVLIPGENASFSLNFKICFQVC